MKVLAIIPARGGSKGIPQKNIKLLNGKPLIAYTIEAALLSKIDKVVVSTDCELIAKVSKKYGASVIIRSPKLATDTAPTLPVLQEVVFQSHDEFDAIITLQPTSPLRTSIHIDEALEIFFSDTNADSLVSVVEVPHNYMPEKIMSLDGRYLTGNYDVKRRQDINCQYARNGAAIYITKTGMLSSFIFGGNIIPYIMKKIDSFDIDDQDDWDICEKIISGT